MADTVSGGLPLLAVAITFLYAYIVLITASDPWARIFVRVNVNGWYAARIPLDIGLFKCLSEICQDYSDFIKEFNGPEKNRRLLAADAIPLYAELPFQREAEAELANYEAPFKHAAIIVLISFAIALLCGAIVLGHIAWRSFVEGRLSVNFKMHASFFWAMSVSLFIGNSFYCILTYTYLNGGGFYYFQGIYVMNLISMLNALVAICCNYFEIESLANHHPYVLINDRPPTMAASIAGSIQLTRLSPQPIETANGPDDSNTN